MLLSITLITLNEEKNIGPTLDSVASLVRELGAEVIVVDSGSSDGTVAIARGHGAHVFVEAWKGYGAQKNSAIDRAGGEWVLSLDADEMVSPELAQEIHDAIVKASPREAVGFSLPRQNFFMNRWIKHGGFWPDRKLRLFRRDAGRFEDRPVHETVKISRPTATLNGALIHHAYPTLNGYLAQMNRYSSLGAEIAHRQGKRGFSVGNIVVRPLLTFVYNYVFRLGFLDGREGLLLHLYHAVYVSWKYAKAWELGRSSSRG